MKQASRETTSEQRDAVLRRHNQAVGITSLTDKLQSWSIEGNKPPIVTFVYADGRTTSFNGRHWSN